jgi:transposase
VLLQSTAMNPQFDPNQLQKLPSEQLISRIVQQQQIIEQLQQEVERLKAKLQLDSQTSSKPPSTDLLKKPEKPSSRRRQNCPEKTEAFEGNRVILGLPVKALGELTDMSCSNRNSASNVALMNFSNSQSRCSDSKLPNW